MVIDPHAGYAAAVRAALPQAQIAVDHFHLVMLANKPVTAARQRVTRDLLGRRGRTIDPAWANRRLLLRGRERLSQPASTRMWDGSSTTDRPGRSSRRGSRRRNSARCARPPPAAGIQRDPRPALRVLPVCADVNIPELTTLAETIETWWPAVDFLLTGLTDARTEGTNRLIRPVKRAACGFRNRENFRRRVRFHCTRRTRRLSARNATVPA